METAIVEKSTVQFRDIDKKEPGWLYKLRKKGWEFYHDSPLPDKSVHLWRYTKPDYFLARQPEILMGLLPPLGQGQNGKPRPGEGEYAAFGFNTDNQAAITHLSPEVKNSGVIFRDLYSDLRENEEQVGQYFGSLVNYDFGKFEALNMALWNTGFFLYIPDNTVVSKPIRINHHAAGPYTSSRLLVVIGKNSEVSIIDDYGGDEAGSEQMANCTSELVAGDSSRVRYVNLQRFGPQCTSLITQRASIGAQGSIYTIFSALGSAISKVNAGTILSGRGADSRMYGIIFGDRKQHIDYHTRHHHQGNESISNIDFKVILKDKANSAYTGLIRIEKETVNCEAYQENRNLLLNPGTRAESIPELEILCDQVRCTHGATMGPVDPEMVFYLRSRGLSEEEAVRMIVTGFVEPTIKQIPADLQPLMRTLVLDKLEGAPK